MLLAAAALAIASPAGAAANTDAEVSAILACRRLPAGAARGDCLERTSADLERAVALPAPPGPPSATPPPAPAAPAAVEVDRSGAIYARVAGLSYEAGRPVFELADGQVWVSREPRRLTRRPGGDEAEIRRSPVGALLHFNGSFFALPVVRRK
jgi:hypothetical protein